MKKKLEKKLTVNRETLKNLGESLALVVGGSPSVNENTCCTCPLT